MNKTNAIKQARANVGKLYRFGDNYRFNYWDESVSSWRESIPFPYGVARAIRGQTLIFQTNKAMGMSDVDTWANIYHYGSHKGSWEKFV